MATDLQGRRRLDDARDLVRREIELGLERKIRVVPVLLPGAVMPSATELPESLAGMVQYNAIEIRESDFDHDSAHLIRGIGLKRRRGLRRVTQAKYFFPVAIGVGAVVPRRAGWG